jgi:hypothetical protein
LWDRARGRQPHGTSRAAKDFWALRDVSFDVQPGEVVGIIGKNGAGKSTLLKILSRITQQTSGEITLRGRVLPIGGLKEKSVAAHRNKVSDVIIPHGNARDIEELPEEVRASVRFAEVEQFIDTPVKRYSSGIMRLVPLRPPRPDLVVDEVRVGDALQKKCLGKMKDVRTGASHRPVRQPQHGGHPGALPARRAARRRPPDDDTGPRSGAAVPRGLNEIVTTDVSERTDGKATAACADLGNGCVRGRKR